MITVGDGDVELRAFVALNADLADFVLYRDGAGKSEVPRGGMERTELLEKFDGEKQDGDEQGKSNQTLFHVRPLSMLFYAL